MFIRLWCSDHLDMYCIFYHNVKTFSSIKLSKDALLHDLIGKMQIQTGYLKGLKKRKMVVILMKKHKCITQSLNMTASYHLSCILKLFNISHLQLISQHRSLNS